MSYLRFIIDPDRSAAFNMAADLHLMQKCEQNELMVVRFYTWKRPSITLGYMQKAYEVLDLERLKKHGGEWIRRPTGGRAVLHEEDITYSCIFSKTLQFMGSSIAQTYKIITSCLINGLKGAGINCDAHDSYDELKEVKREVKLPCFLAPNRDEVMVKGRKLVGSAQKRTQGAVLQHGSIPISAAYQKLPSFLNISESEKDRQVELLRRKSICIDEILSDGDFQFLSSALMGGFMTLPIESKIEFWTAEEEQEIQAFAESADFKNVWMSSCSVDQPVN